MIGLKLCRDCKFSEDLFRDLDLQGKHIRCTRLERVEVDLVSGKHETVGKRDAYWERYQGDCGKEGRFFKRKEKPVHGETKRKRFFKWF